MTRHQLLSSNQLGLTEDGELENLAALDGEQDVRVVGQRDQIVLLVRVFDGELVVGLDLVGEDALHHQEQFVVVDVIVVNDNLFDLLLQSHFEDDLSAQVLLLTSHSPHRRTFSFQGSKSQGKLKQRM